jgi:FkbM family methyltransferase
MARVLIFSDEPETRGQAESLLRDQGYEVACACSPEEARQALAAAVPDLVLVDFTIFGERGTIRAANAAHAHGIPMILMRASKARTWVSRDLKFPMLEKPLSLPRLAELVAQTLSARNHGSPAKPSFTNRSLLFARNVPMAIEARLLRAAGGFFDRYVREYRYRGLRFEIPRELTTPELRARFLLHRYEAPERALTRKYITADATVLELGGCLGVVSCLVNRQLADPRRHVVFEPHPLITRYLEANRANNGCRFQIRQQIISNAQTATFYCREPFIAGSSTVRLGRDEIEVATTTVERVEQETGFTFDSLVVDIEGGEREFFAENVSLVERVRRVIVELHPRIIGNAACAEIRDRFAAAGLSLRRRRGGVEAWLRPTL